jgi:hypothetical protein
VKRENILPFFIIFVENLFVMNSKTILAKLTDTQILEIIEAVNDDYNYPSDNSLVLELCKNIFQNEKTSIIQFIALGCLAGLELARRFKEIKSL